MSRRSFKPYVGPESFTGFGSGSGLGGGSFFQVSRSAAPELYALAKQFPQAFSSALKSIGFFLRGELKTALVQGGPKNSAWPELSRMHIYRRMDLLRAGHVDHVTGEWRHGKRFRLKKRLGYKNVSGKERMMDRWQGRGITRRRAAMGGRLVNAVRYRMVNRGQVDIGALNPSTAQFLEAVQGGKRGSRGLFQFTGSQAVTPAMRRAFWAAGIPLSKGTTSLEQPERPLIDPVFQAVLPQLEQFMVSKIRARLAKQGIELE